MAPRLRLPKAGFVAMGPLRPSLPAAGLIVAGLMVVMVTLVAMLAPGGPGPSVGVVVAPLVAGAATPDAVIMPTPDELLSLSPTASPSPSPSATHDMPPARTGSPTPSPSGPGDFTIASAGTCVWFVNAVGQAFVRPSLVTTWQGPGVYPANRVRIVADTTFITDTAMPATSSGALSPQAGGTGALIRFRGHSVAIVATVDFLNTVPESNETNNTITITAKFPATTPPVNVHQSISCL
jgi:hypothetical protein